MSLEIAEQNYYQKTNNNEPLYQAKNLTGKLSEPIIIVKDKYLGIRKMTIPEYISYINQHNNHKPQKEILIEQKPYELGEISDDTRTIDIENVTDPLKPGSTAPSLDNLSQEEIDEYRENLNFENGNIDEFKQGKRGDCYFLAGLKAISQSEEGRKTLKENITKNSDESYTVTLPGALKAREHYIKKGLGNKCAITGKYTITKSAIEKAKKLAGKSYAFGDIEVILFELAMEAFRAEVQQTNTTLGKKSRKYIAGEFCTDSKEDPLSSGQAFDAIYLLTGKKSDIYEAKKSKIENIRPYKYGEFGFVGETPKTSLGTLKASSRDIELVEVNNIYDKESDLQKMLDKYKGHESEYAITVSVIVGEDGPDGTTKKMGGHALTVTKISNNYIEVVNPWDTTKPERIPRGVFEQMAKGLTITPLKEHKKQNIFNMIGNYFK